MEGLGLVGVWGLSVGVWGLEKLNISVSFHILFYLCHYYLCHYNL